MLILGALLFAGTAPTCDVGGAASARSAHDLLSRRAIEIVTLASQTGPMAEARLKAIVTPFAPFDLGAGDVGRPLGCGIQGARALTETLNADHYRYLGWDYMDRPADACANHKITVEFSNEKSGRKSDVEFAFANGVVVAASGWECSFVSGTIPEAKHAPIGN